jgi:6-methylsalicylate decarboxylase
MPARLDIHQHVWTAPLLDALARRRSLPFVARTDGLTLLHCAGERPYIIDVAAEAPARRAALLELDGVDGAVVAISSPIGIETLPRHSATELIDAHLDGLRELGPRFAGWGPVPLHEASPDDVDDLLARGCVGISIPAGALSGVDALYGLGPVLERVAAAGVPMFVHPGPADAGATWQASLRDPLWWPALTGYVSQMQAAWLTFATHGRREHPDLIVVFAMLAGCAPLLAERLATRGGPPVDLQDDSIHYDTSSYGPAAIEMMVQVVGGDQLVYGSDRPVIDPVPTGRDANLRENSARFLTGLARAA